MSNFPENTWASDWNKAVEKLEEMTRSGEVAWSAATEDRLKRDGLEGAAYLACLQNRWIAVYEYRYTELHPSFAEPATDVAIEFVDWHGNLQWRWPQASHRWALLDAIRYRISGAHEFLGKFLAQNATA